MRPKKPVNSPARAALDERPNEKQRSSYIPEPYVPSGGFHNDFLRLCQDRGMSYVPSVCLRPSMCSIHSLVQKKQSEIGSVKPGKRRKSLKGSIPKAAIEHVRQEHYRRRSSIIPCTFVTKDRFQYFQPNIQVDQAQEENENTVTAIYIRGWKVDVSTMEVFKQCWPVMSMLQTVQLWNVNLETDTLLLLASFLPQCARLTNLILDGNSLHHKPLACFVKGSLLKNLSLRFCQLTDQDVREIASALSPANNFNTRLRTLNLSNNQIEDQGAVDLAEVLKANFEIVELNLASNAVGDEGAVQIARALTWFPVKSEYIFRRRQLIHELPMKAKEQIPSSEIVITAEKDKHKPKKTKSCSKSPKRKSVKTNVSEIIIHEVLPVIQGAKPVPFKPYWFQKGDRHVEAYDNSNPLLRAGIIHQEELWLPGNRTLASLNLSRNRIGDRGVQALLAAMDDQTIPLPESPRGLLRLVMHGNNFSKDSPQAQRLAHRIKLRDPFFLCPLLHLQRTNVSPCAMPVSVLV